MQIPILTTSDFEWFGQLKSRLLGRYVKEALNVTAIYSSDPCGKTMNSRHLFSYLPSDQISYKRISRS